MSPPDPSWRDPAYLLDMLVAARKVREFTKDSNWEQFEQDHVLQHATMYSIQIIGEAARRVSAATRDAHPEIPWPDIVGMRHRLVHDYLRIDAKKVWETVERDVPALIAALEPLVPPETD